MTAEEILLGHLEREKRAHRIALAAMDAMQREEALAREAFARLPAWRRWIIRLLS